MTKNWAVVEEEIRELAGAQKKEVEEIKRIMKSRGFDAWCVLDFFTSNIRFHSGLTND
jgi:hypothetical protein